MNREKVGIASIGLHFPSLALSVQELAKLRDIDPEKFTRGLGCETIALCPEGYTIVHLACEATKRAIAGWTGDINDIGLIVTATETAMDMSRPLSAWVAEEVGVRGRIRSYEVKHACYGGTAAIRQAVEWKLSGVAPGKAALVVAADISLYETGQPSEPTQGAGAIAIVIDEPLIAEIDPISYPWSKPAFDFWRPVGRAHPLVEGQFSLHCYEEAATNCFNDLIGTRDPEVVFNEFDALCFHTPFPKMVKKALTAVCKGYGWDDEKIETLYKTKVDHTMRWNRLCGNTYTASVWIAVANTIRGMAEGKRIAAFSYGSGCGAELVTLRVGKKAKRGEWGKDVEFDLNDRVNIDGETYDAMRKKIDGQ